MKEFLSKDFLLSSDTAIDLYSVAEKLPIVDYHCHINTREIFENRKFENITEAWLEGDHYKWRLMRINGVEEKYITGDATDYEKFVEFSRVLPRAIGNPIYHWAHLELKRYFDCDMQLSEKTASAVWNHCNKKLKEDDSLRVRGIIERSNVETIVTTDDPVDSLEWHSKLKGDDNFRVNVLPAWRPDRVIAPEKNDFVDYISELETVSKMEISDFDTLCASLKARMDHFQSLGCKASDHGFEGIMYAYADLGELNIITKKLLKNEKLCSEEYEKYRYNLMLFLAEEYEKREWVMELHLGVLRNINSSKYNLLGPDMGYDVISPYRSVSDFICFLNDLESKNTLPKTLIFSLNSQDNDIINTVVGSFQQAGVKGKVQQGAAWWFNDTKSGIIQQLTSYANLSVLGNFIGMLTDSRSFLSYTRHEYFRRILCEIIGSLVENGEYPNDIYLLTKLIEDICYNNVKLYFGY